MSTALSLPLSVEHYISHRIRRILVRFRTPPPRDFASKLPPPRAHRPGLPNLVDGGGVGRRHCQPSLWPRPTPINCTNGKSTVRSSQPKMMYRRFRGTYVPESRSARRGAAVVLLDLPPLKESVYVCTRERGGRLDGGGKWCDRGTETRHFVALDTLHPSSDTFERHHGIRTVSQLAIWCECQ